jgi:hypothetical protein
MADMANRTGEERWRERIEGWRASGLTSVKYCEGRDFTAEGLRHWAHVLKKESGGQG